MIKTLVLENIESRVKEEEFLALSKTDRHRIETARKAAEEKERLENEIQKALLQKLELFKIENNLFPKQEGLGDEETAF